MWQRVVGAWAGSLLLAAAQSALPKAVAVTGSPMYLAPDASSQQVGSVLPGQDLGLMGKSGGFVEVFNGVSGWIPDHGLARYDDPAAPELLYAAAMKLEGGAETTTADRPEAQNAARLFLSIYSDFPNSPRAGEALFRGADIRWQLGLADMPHRRSAEDRQFPDDSGLHKVIGKFPGTPWAARAAFDLLDERFTCNWNNKPECLQKEMNEYHDYLKKYPASPQGAQAYYQMVYRAGIGWTLLHASDARKAADYKQQANALAAEAKQRYGATDAWVVKAGAVATKVNAGTDLDVPTGG